MIGYLKTHLCIEYNDDSKWERFVKTVKLFLEDHSGKTFYPNQFVVEKLKELQGIFDLDYDSAYDFLINAYKELFEIISKHSYLDSLIEIEKAISR